MTDILAKLEAKKGHGVAEVREAVREEPVEAKLPTRPPTIAMNLRRVFR